MAIAVRSEHPRHVRHRPPLIRQHGNEPGAGLALIMVALVIVGITTVGLSGRLIQVSIPRVIVSSPQPPGASRPVDGVVPETRPFSVAALSIKPIVAVDAAQAVPAPPEAVEAPAPLPAPVVAAAAPPAPAGPSAPVAAAAVPSASAAPSAPAAGVLAVGGHAKVVNTDGQGVVLYAAPRPSGRQPAGLLEGTVVTVLELQDADWAQVQSASKQTGWVHASFLAPAD